MKINVPILLILVCLLVLFSCAPVYSPYIYDKTAELKTQSLSILSKANEPFSKLEPKVLLLKADLESVYQQEKMRKHNKVKIQQWDLLLNTKGFLLYGSLEKWQKDTVMNERFVELQRKLVGEAFDLMLETEKNRLSN